MASLVNATFLSVILLILQSYIQVCTASIQCFKCTIITPPSFRNETKRLCSNFDYSKRYMVDCPQSTFCMKKYYTVDLKSKVINGVVRDCAQQTNIIQDYEDGRWQRRLSIEEPYQEGCSESHDGGQKLSKTTYCYCRGDFCNTSLRPDGHFCLNAIAVIFTCLTMKLLYYST